jgi:hypothetical protein
MGGSGWGTPNEGGRIIPSFVIAGYDCIAVDGTITRTWRQDREEELALRQRLYRRFGRIRWPQQPLRLLRPHPIL